MKHTYAPDTRVLDPTGTPIGCVVCGFPKANWRHRNVPADAIAARVMGEEPDGQI